MQGWISVTPISVREVYKGVAEISIYIRQSVSGKGVSSILLEALCEECRKSGYRMLQSSIFLEK
ncbi:N-acetyltransferase family protein [Lysinibacillus sp. 3P01SB]|uniref:GNAT family N-acetyltransferase n=1 Tax=Lysinibacillus sp. 3P01SB TaxID=3132284 RepID=UPI0039A5A4CD